MALKITIKNSPNLGTLCQFSNKVSDIAFFCVLPSERHNAQLVCHCLMICGITVVHNVLPPVNDRIHITKPSKNVWLC